MRVSLLQIILNHVWHYPLKPNIFSNSIPKTVSVKKPCTCAPREEYEVLAETLTVHNRSNCKQPIY